MNQRFFNTYIFWLTICLFLAIILIPNIINNAYQLRVLMLLLIYEVDPVVKTKAIVF